MRKSLTAAAAAVMVFAMLTSGCEQKKEAPKQTEQKAGEQAPAKKSPVGC